MTNPLDQEVARRRTFAIISHPDAGKTTLTEKLLLFGGAIQMAGAIKARKAARHATSDWMKVEQERGISVTTSVMKFAHRDCEINLLDTPGFSVFLGDSRAACRVADAALFVVSAATGIKFETEALWKAAGAMHAVVRISRRPPATRAAGYSAGRSGLRGWR